MSNKYYQLYIESIINLVETIVIKSEQNAKVINEWVSLNYGESAVDVNNPRSWKYYKNISGQYHTTDEMIHITSLDTADIIEFTLASLINNPATRSAYRYGTRYYRELITQHPTKEQLILGILYPCDIDVALAAPNHTILSYPKDLIEDNEINLIRYLQEWIYKFKNRWYNIQFNNNHVYYNIGNDGVMFASMVPTIINLRLRACKTNEAHSFHIREYLASHGMLDEFLDQMTRKQALFFYRNIAYIERNNGKVDTFEWLVDKVLTDRNIPLSKYTMCYDISRMDAIYYPEVRFRKTPLNSVYSNIDEQTVNYKLDTVLNKELPLAPDNARYISDNFVKINNLFVDSLSSVVQTKMLESSITDYTGSTKYTLQTLGLNYWLYLASNNLYTGYVKIPDINSGLEVIVKPLDAYIYYMYVFAKSINVTFTYLPILKTFKVFRVPTPPIEQLMGMVDPKIVPRATVETLIQNIPSFVQLRTPEAFAAKITDLLAVHNAFNGAVSLQDNNTRRGMVQAIVSSLFMDVEVRYAGNVTLIMHDWLLSKGLNADIRPEECEAYCNKIYESATGISTEVTSNTTALQKAMLGIMTRLSSYSIQFLSNVNKSNLRPLSWSAMRFDEPNTAAVSYINQEITDTLFDATGASTSHRIDIPIGTSVKTASVSTVSDDYKPIEISSTAIRTNNSRSTKKTLVNVGKIRFNTIVDDSVYSGTGPIKYMNSYKSFYELTDEEKITIKSIYNNCIPDPVVNTLVEITDVIDRDTISSFEYNRTKIIIKSFGYEYMLDTLHNGVKIIISDDLNGLVMSGGTFRLPGLVSIGFDHYLDALDSTFQTQTVPGLKYVQQPLYQPIYEPVYQPHYALHNVMGIGESLTIYTGDPTGAVLKVGTIPIDTVNLGSFKIVNGKIIFE